MSNQLLITGGAKVRNLEGVLTGTSGVVSSVPYGGANGVATLDGSGKVPLSQLPASVITYLGTWNAATNTPTLTNGVGDVGDLYICNVAGTVNFGAGPITFAVGDWVIYSGTTWEKSGGASGTVTSVAMTTPTGLSVTGSPITTSGTLALSLSSGYTIPTTSFLSGLVPYTGATNDVDLGTHSLSADYLEVSTTSTQTADVAQIVWNASDGTFDMGLLNDVTLQAGQEMHIYGKASGAISNGQAVMFAGSQGDHLLISVADAATINANPEYFIGVATQDFANNEFGYVTVFGKVRNIDTTAYTLGSVLYYDSTTATDGALTPTIPSAPNAKIIVAAVVRVHATQGILMVRPHTMPKLSDIQNVGITSVANTDGIFYNSSTSVWENKTIAEVLGYTPANAATYVPYTGATTNVNLGTNILTANQLWTSGTSNSGLFMNQSSAITAPEDSSTYTSIKAYTNRYLYFSFGQTAAYKRFRFDVNGLTDNTTLTYTMPNASGTLALTSDIPTSSTYVDLTSAQTITGIKTFTNEQLFGNGMTLTGGYITYTSGSFNLTLNTNLLTANRNIYLPDASGTVALTSNLSSYVPYSGATGSVVLGANNLTAQHIILDGVPSSNVAGSLLIKQSTVFASNPAYTTITSTGGNFTVVAAASGSTWYQAKFDLSSLTVDTLRTYTLPNTSGTIALTSNLSAYLPLTGGNLTGDFSVDSTVLYVDTTANKVGIGNNAPQTLLDISGAGTYDGAIRVRSTGTNTPSVYLATVADTIAYGYVGTVGSIPFYINTNNTTKVAITSSGNVGIGTTSPSGLFEVSNSGSGVTVGDFLVDAANKNVYVGRLSSTSNDNTNFIVRNRIGSALLYVTGNNGNVGIGTSSPSSILEVKQTSGEPTITANYNNQYYAALFSGNGYSGVGAFSLIPFIFYSNSIERMRIPGSISGDAVLLINSSSSVWDTTYRGVIEINGNSSALLGLKTGGNPRSYFYTTGADTYVVNTVSGGTLFCISSSGGVYLSSGATSWASNSDERLKDITGYINNAVDSLMTLRAIKHTWKSNNDKKEHLALIAQDVQKEFPQVVDKYKLPSTPDKEQIDDTEYLSVRYTELIPVLVKAIQELKAELDELKNK
jgi:hypothetical protein